MKFTSLLSLIVRPQLRTNAVLFFFLVFFSLHSLISSVRLIPNEKIKAIWNDQDQFISCFKEDTTKGGTLRWYRLPNTLPIDENPQAPLYATQEANSGKLFMKKISKKYSGIYECRHELDGKVVSSDRVEIKVYNDINMAEKIGNKRSYVGTEGHSFSIPCTAWFDSESGTSSDSQQLYWFHNGRQIPEKGDQQFKATTKIEQSMDYKSIRSTLVIHKLDKEHEGVYLCQATYANPYLSSMKDFQINLRVQFAPRFLDNTNKKVWISEVSQGPLEINVNCTVNADPISEFEWRTHDDMRISKQPIGGRIPNMPHYTITETENMSVLTLTYEDLSQIQKSTETTKHQDHKRKDFKCIASNPLGSVKQDFAINIGQLPDPPIIENFSYVDGFLTLWINTTEVKPPIDRFRVDVDNRNPIYFNDTYKIEGTNTYRVEANMPSGEHQLTLYAHNPVGWSEVNPQIPNPHLIVRSGSTFAQQYSNNALTLLASVLALRYAF